MTKLILIALATYIPLRFLTEDKGTQNLRNKKNVLLKKIWLGETIHRLTSWPYWIILWLYPIIYFNYNHIQHAIYYFAGIGIIYVFYDLRN